MATKQNQLMLEPGNDEEDTDLRDDLEIDEPDEGGELEVTEESDVERQAREMGWHPREEYAGPPGRWVDAETFIKRGQEILPVLRDNNKRLLERAEGQTREITEMKKQMAEQAEVLKELREMARTAGKRGYDQAIADLEAQRREAVASGDVEGFDKISEQIEETTKARARAVPSEAPKQTAPQIPQEVVDFVNSNPWYNNDPDLNREMQGFHVYLRTAKPGQSLADNLEEAKGMVMAKYPQKFGKTNGTRQPAERRAAPVAQPSGARAAPRRAGNSLLDSIEDAGERQTAKTQFAKMKRQFPDYTEEEFMAVYDNPHADVLTIQRTQKGKARG